MERTSTLEDARRLCIEGNEQGFDAIVAVGGDGTINQVLRGMYRDDGTRRSQAAMGVVYTGTSPDFCKSYGIPLDHAAAVRLVAAGRSRMITVGRIALKDEQGLEQVVFFGCCANIGLGAELARRANSGIRKIAGDTVGTFLSLIQTIGSYEPAPLRLVVDGQERRIEEVWNLSVGRTRLIASGIKVSHELSPADDRFYLMSISQMKLKKWPGILAALYSGKPMKTTESFLFEHCGGVEVKACDGHRVEVEMDGDPAGFLPCQIGVAQDKLELISEGEAC
jgi:diacylglycerol kinase family enzyme